MTGRKGVRYDGSRCQDSTEAPVTDRTYTWEIIALYSMEDKRASSGGRSEGREDVTPERSFRSDGGETTASSRRPDPQFLRAGIAVFGAISLGALVMNYLFLAITDSPTIASGLGVQGTAGGVPQDQELFFSVVASFNTVLQAGLVVAAVLGIYVGRVAERIPSAPKTSAIAAAGGVAVPLLGFVVLMLLTAPDGADLEIGELLKPVIAVMVGAAVAGGGAAYGVNNWLEPSRDE